MKATVLCLAAAASLGIADHPSFARRIPLPEPVVDTHVSRRAPYLNSRFFRSSHVDTFVLASYDFAGLDPQGWSTHDLTAQIDTFFHVDDFGGVPGYAPISGTKSLWCGTNTNPHFPGCIYLACGPGYGNDWHQIFESVSFPSSGDVTLSFQLRYDVEPGYDFAYVEYLNASAQWVELATYDDAAGPLPQNFVIPEASLPGAVKVRFRFVSDELWSDEDCLYSSNGAVVLDDITLQDQSGILDVQNFEGEPVGARETIDGDWHATFKPGFGDYAALFPGSGVLQEDPCVFTVSSVWGFSQGSTYNYACGGHPEQKVVPYGNASAQYINNEIRSPLIPWGEDSNGLPVPSTASGALLEFDVYRDLSLDNMIFYEWHVRSFVDGCAGPWRDRNSIYFGSFKDWFAARFELGDLIEPGATHIQVALGVMDGCNLFYCFGEECHSHAPLFANARVVRVDHAGPVFAASDLDLFHDAFPFDGTSTGTVRIDTADLLPFSSPNVLPGDSAVVSVSEPNYGLGADVSGGPAVYLHVRDIGAKSGLDVSGDLSRWPLVSATGGWTVLRCDTVRTGAGAPVADAYCVDLNDTLYSPPDTILYYFSARDGAGRTTYWSRLAGTTDSELVARSAPTEMTCLPGAGGILYVSDEGTDPDAQAAFDHAFAVMGVPYDRYDVVGLGPAAGVTNVAQQLVPYYEAIVWNTGATGGVGGGKTDEFGLLLEFLDGRPSPGGVYISGDETARIWNQNMTPSGATFRATYMNFNLVHDNHRAVGQPVSPAIIGQPGSIFHHTTAWSSYADSLVVLGGCPLPNDFDVMQSTGNSVAAALYSGNPAHGAVLTQTTLNPLGEPMNVVFSGFSYQFAQENESVPYKVEPIGHFRDIWCFITHCVALPVGVPGPAPYRNALVQNAPNPFNPVTEIRYSIAERSPVSMIVYDVAGRRVRTLVAGEQSPRAEGFRVMWDGRDERGRSVASGVYFYRLVAGGYTQTRKMVLLK